MLDKIKRDTETNWAKAKNFIPKKDEVIIYDCKDTKKLKIGDGVNYVNDLPFANSDEIISIPLDYKEEDEMIIMEILNG